MVTIIRKVRCPFVGRKARASEEDKADKVSAVQTSSGQDPQGILELCFV